VEVDETYVGGKPRIRQGQKGRQHKGGRGTSKTPVVAMVERKGRVRARPIQRVNADTLQAAILGNVSRDSTIMTDEWAAYGGIGQYYKGGHHTVAHGKGEYVRGNAHVNTAEGFFSLLKRGIFGVFHSVSKRHLHRYVSEFEYRYNTRGLDDGARTLRAIKKADGKRLRYRASA
jgi:transposase-like protein